MRVIKKENPVYMAIMFNGLNVDEIRNFVPSDIYKSYIDMVTNRIMPIVNSIPLKRTDVVVKEDDGFKVYSKYDFELKYSEYIEETKEKTDYKRYIGIELVSARKLEDRYSVIDKTGFIREMSIEAFEKQFKPMEDYLGDKGVLDGFTN